MSDGEEFELLYTTDLGSLYIGDSQKISNSNLAADLKEQVNLIFTSPPFPLNRRKAYGNKKGDEYVEWLSDYADIFRDLLCDDGSIVIELGNAWEKGIPAMSTLSMEALMKLKEKGDFFLCQEFIWYNPTRLPSPVQWVNIERIRVKDAFTRLWWLSSTPKPKADNKKVLQEYSDDMKRLLKTKKYNSGRRPSEHKIGEESFLKDHGGSIPPNVLTIPNTSTDSYLKYCKENEITSHPARMPPDLAEFFIRFLTDEDDLVLDPFAGSNITGWVAESLNRRWVSIELESKYGKASKARFQED